MSKLKLAANNDFSPRSFARISVAGYRAQRARRIEANQHVIVIQRCGSPVREEPQATTARLLWRAHHEIERVGWLKRIWRHLWRK